MFVDVHHAVSREYVVNFRSGKLMPEGCLSNRDHGVRETVADCEVRFIRMQNFFQNGRIPRYDGGAVLKLLNKHEISDLTNIWGMPALGRG